MTISGHNDLLRSQFTYSHVEITELVLIERYKATTGSPVRLACQAQHLEFARTRLNDNIWPQWPHRIPNPFFSTHVGRAELKLVQYQKATTALPARLSCQGKHLGSAWTPLIEIIFQQWPYQIWINLLSSHVEIPQTVFLEHRKTTTSLPARLPCQARNLGSPWTQPTHIICHQWPYQIWTNLLSSHVQIMQPVLLEHQKATAGFPARLACPHTISNLLGLARLTLPVSSDIPKIIQ